MTEYVEQTKMPSLYTILGLSQSVCDEPNCEELIHKAYVSKAKKYHPDKCDTDANMKQVFELITHAYNILRDSTKRSEYNDKLKIQNQCTNDFDSLRAGYEKYIKTVEPVTSVTESDVLGQFEYQSSKLNKRHQFNPNDINLPVSEDESRKKLQELIDARNKDAELFTPGKISFNESDEMDLNRFNAMFDKINNKNVPNSGDITSYNRPDPWIGSNKNFNFSDFDMLDNIYSNVNDRYDSVTASFASVDDCDLPKYDYQSLANEDINASYVNNHNELEDNYYEIMKSKILERTQQTKDIGSMKYSDYKLNDTAGYGIYDELTGYEQDNELLNFSNPELLRLLSVNLDKPR